MLMHACQAVKYKDVDAVLCCRCAELFTRKSSKKSSRKERLLIFLAPKIGRENWRTDVEIKSALSETTRLSPMSSVTKPAKSVSKLQEICFTLPRDANWGNGVLHFRARGLRFLRRLLSNSGLHQNFYFFRNHTGIVGIFPYNFSCSHNSPKIPLIVIKAFSHASYKGRWKNLKVDYVDFGLP